MVFTEQPDFSFRSPQDMLPGVQSSAAFRNMGSATGLLDKGQRFLVLRALANKNMKSSFSTF